MSHKKFEPDRFSRFDVYCIQTDIHPDRQTNKQTKRQAKFIYRFLLYALITHILNIKAGTGLNYLYSGDLIYEKVKGSNGYLDYN